MKNPIYRIFFLSIYGAAFLFFLIYRGESRDVGLIVFLFGCCIVPFYYAHFLSGYIVGVNDVVGRFGGNLLININFLRYLVSHFFQKSSKLMVIEFFLSYVAGVVGTIVAFVLRN